MRFFALLPVFLPAIATAQIADAPLAVIRADLTGDGLADMALLTESAGGGDADLSLSVGMADGGFDLVAVAPGLVWVGGIGQQPDLALAANGSLQVLSMNESIGRNRWFQTLTIAFRDGQFKVAGITYSWYDTLNSEDQGTCDVNLLNGRGELFSGVTETKTSFRTTDRGGPVATWAWRLPDECGLN